MSDSPTIRDRILDAAEVRARCGGYHGFSFRDIAADVGIKSASVHYHFQTKTELACALTERYTRDARDFLGSPESVSPISAAKKVTDLFRRALLNRDQMCLCGLFGAERDALPSEVVEATAAYFQMVLNYLEAAFGSDWRGERPEALLARLEGALILARSLRRPEVFEMALQG